MRLEERRGAVAVCRLFGRRGLGLLVCLFAASVFGAPAQKPAFLSHQAWSTEEGLPQSSISQIFQSHDGYLWLATEGGVSRFDGAGFKNYNHESYPAFTSDDVSSIAEAPVGVLWFGTSDGLIRSEGTSLRRFTAKDGLPSSSILSLATGSDGALLVLTTAGLARRGGPGFVALPGAFASVSSLERAGDGAVWLLGGPQPMRYGAAEPVRFPAAKAAAEPVLGVQEAAGGVLWVRTARTVACMSGGLRRVFRVGRDFSGSRVQSMLVDRDGTAWIGTNRGLFTVGTTTSARAQRVASLGAESILSIFEDREGNHWIGTEDSGLHALRARKFRTEGSFGGASVTAVVETGDGAVWYGTRGQGLRCIENGLDRAPVASAALTSPIILSLAPGRHGDIWAGTPDGLNHIEHGRVRKYTSASGLPDDFVRSLLVSRDGSVWVGTRRGLAHLDRGRIVSVTKAKGMASNSIGPIYEASGSHGNKGRDQPLWVGTAAGLTLLRDGRAQNFSIRDGLPGSIVTAITQGRGDDIWVGVYDAGLSLFAGGRFRRVRAAGLPQVVDALTVDATGHLWVRGNRGVYRASLQALRRCAMASRACTAPIARYGVADGLPSDESAGEGTPSMWQTASGDLWLATRKGLALAEPRDLPLNTAPPPVLVERFTVDTLEQPLTDGPLRISSGHHSFTFDYAALSYTEPSKVRYRYKLEGFDRDWTDAGARRTAYYTSLPGRKYRFRVIAENNDGVWNDTGAQVRFSVRPAFYLRPWFYALLLVSVCAAVLLAIRIRLRAVRRQFALVLNERNRVAREIHDTLAQDLVSVSLQIELASQSVGANKLTEASEQLREARSLVKRGLEEARQSIWNLRANAARNSLPSRLGKAVEEFARTHPASRVKIGGAYRKLGDRTEDEVLRIAQESLSNIGRHAAAAEVLVHLHYSADRLALTVQDDGCGFRYPAVRGMDGHYGVRGMEERAAALGARFTIASSPGAGTTVTLVVPLRGREGLEA